MAFRAPEQLAEVREAVYLIIQFLPRHEAEQKFSLFFLESIGMSFHRMLFATALVLPMIAAPTFGSEGICPTTPARPCILSAGVAACRQKAVAERLRELERHEDYNTADQLVVEMRCKVLHKGDRVIAEEFNVIGPTRLHLPGSTEALYSDYALEGAAE